MKKFLLSLLLILFCSIYIFGNGSFEEVNSNKLRVVSLAPNITEIIYELGAGDFLVGRSDFCNWPSEVQNVACAGNVWQPNVEIIVSLQPDVVLAASLLDPSYKDAIERAGIKVVHILAEENLLGTYDLIRQIGSSIGFEKQAEDLCVSIKNQFDEIQKVVAPYKGQKSCAYLLGWGMFGDYAATGDTFINGLIELAGGKNIASDSVGWAISQELLINGNPNVIVLPDYSYAPADEKSFRNTQPYSSLTGKILKIDGDIADRQGVRSPQFAKALAQALYPEAFE